MAVLPPEILHDILGCTTPSWRWGCRWKDERKRMLGRTDLIWFLNLPLVNKQFDDILIHHFHAAITAGLIGHDHPICRGPPTRSTIAMGRRLLWRLCGRVVTFKGQGRRCADCRKWGYCDAFCRRGRACSPCQVSLRCWSRASSGEQCWAYAASLGCRGGHADVVRVLLNTGEVDVNFQDRLGRTPLIWAAERGFDNVVKELLQEEKIDVNLMDGDAEDVGVTPLAVAAVMGREDFFQSLFHHSKVDRTIPTVFRCALIGGKVSIVRTITEAIPDTLELYECDEDETALFRAAEEGSEEVVRYLLSLNSFPNNDADPNGRTSHEKKRLAKVRRMEEAHKLRLVRIGWIRDTLCRPHLDGWVNTRFREIEHLGHCALR